MGWLWRRWGRGPPTPSDIGEYWREVPDDPPAVGSLVMQWGWVDDRALPITLVDLAQRGYLSITEEREGLQ